MEKKKLINYGFVKICMYSIFEILDYYKTAIGYLDNIFLFEILKRPVNQRYNFKYLIPEVYVVVDLH